MQLIGALFGFALLAGCAALQEIDSGLYSGTQAITKKDLITGERAIGFTDRQKQIKQGDAAMQKIVGNYARVNEQVNRVMYERLVRVFNKVHGVSHYSHENWRVFLLPEDGFNAFVTGGTSVAVYQGLMNAVTDDAALAAILGHEIAHVAANHAFEKQSLLIGLAAGDNAGEGFGFAYNALQEEEADKVGAVYSALSGYDPRAVSAVWQRFAKHGDDWSWFRTHPASADRAEATRILGDIAAQYYTPDTVHPDHRKLSRCNNLWCDQ